MDERLRAISSEHGVFLTRDALALGYDEKSIRRLIRAGVWQRVRHGAYVSMPEWEALDPCGRHRLRARAVLRTGKTGHLLSHTSALVEFGVPTWDLDLRDVHVTRPDMRGGRREAGVCQHQGRLIENDYWACNGVSLTSPTRTALDITTITDPEHALVAIDGLLHAGLTTIGQTMARYEGMTHRPHTLGTGLILSLADGRAATPGKTRARYLCWRYGLPKPELQYEIYAPNGELVAVVDLAWPDYGVFLEFDGMIKYGALLKDGESPKDVIVREQRREEEVCALTGWRSIRLIWRDYLTPDRTARRIARELRCPVRAN